MQLQGIPLKRNRNENNNKTQKKKLKENQLTHENCSTVLDTSIEARTDSV